MFDPLYIFVAALTGFVVGLTGVGGGALMTPVLLLFGIPPITAIATDLWFAAITKSFGALIHHRSGQVDWRVVTRLWFGSLPSALVVVFLLMLGIVVPKVDWLNFAIAFLVFLTALGLIFSPQLNAWVRNREFSRSDKFQKIQPAITVFAGALLGFCVALTSVGAGALGALLLLYLYPLRMSTHRLVGTDTVHAVPLAMVAGFGYLIAGKVDGTILLNLLIGSVPMVVLGAFLSRRFSGRYLQLALAVMLIVIGFKII